METYRMKIKSKPKNKDIRGENYVISCCDAIDYLVCIPENSVDCCIVDGPYNLSFMGTSWDSFKVEKTAKSASGFGKNSKTNENQFAAARVRYNADLEANRAFEQWNETWARELYAALKPGAFLLAFGCTKTEHRLVSGIENAGFEIRDKISWWYATGSPKGVNLKGKNAGKGTGISPAVEFICVARKPISEKTVEANVNRWGTGCYNINDCRINRDKKDIPGWHNSGANGSNGYRGTNTFRIRAMSADEIQGRNAEKGRWPKNIMLSHYPTCRAIGIKTEKGHAVNVGYTKNLQAPGWGKRRCITEKIPDTTEEIYECVEGCPIAELEKQKPGASRFYFVAKPSKSERDKGLSSLEEKKWVQYQTANGTSGKASSLSAGRNTQRRNLHPTLKPVKLMEYLIRLVCPESGIVLDHFMGSGTTGVAALNVGRKFLGCDNNAEYFEYARLRLADAEKNNA
jgi:DNA modification methylase